MSAISLAGKNILVTLGVKSMICPLLSTINNGTGIASSDNDVIFPPIQETASVRFQTATAQIVQSR